MLCDSLGKRGRATPRGSTSRTPPFEFLKGSLQCLWIIYEDTVCISLWNCFNKFLWEEIVLNLLDVCCTLALLEKDTQWRSHSRNYEFRISYSSFPRKCCGSRKANRSSHHWIDKFILKWNLVTISCWSILEISKPESIHTDYLIRGCFVFVCFG